MSETPAPKADKADKGCPICGKPRDPRFAPFCSKRCGDIDLGRWLKGSYVIPGEPRTSPDEEDDDER